MIKITHLQTYIIEQYTVSVCTSSLVIITIFSGELPLSVDGQHEQLARHPVVACHLQVRDVQPRYHAVQLCVHAATNQYVFII